MNTTEIIDTLKYSFGYEDFMNTYNEMIENGTLKEALSNTKDRKEFFKSKNEIKKRFQKEYEKEYPEKAERCLRKLIYIYKADKSDFRTTLELIDNLPLVKQYYINQRIKDLKVWTAIES